MVLVEVTCRKYDREVEKRCKIRRARGGPPLHPVGVGLGVQGPLIAEAIAWGKIQIEIVQNQIYCCSSEEGAAIVRQHIREYVSILRARCCLHPPLRLLLDAAGGSRNRLSMTITYV